GERGVTLRLLAGTGYGRSSPVETLSPMFLVEAELPAGGELALPDEHAERAAFVIEGNLRVADRAFAPGHMLVFAPDRAATLAAPDAPARLLLLGGAPPDGPRYIEWNFVSSSAERIARAKADWKAGRFPRVPGDELEFIPL